MSLTFYHCPNSTSNITADVLSELDHGSSQPLAKRRELSIQAGDTKSPHYLSTVNPNGKVPAIVHDGVCIWESAAITMYLGEVFGEKKGLYPALGPNRGEAMKWIVWANIVLADAGSRLAYSLPLGTPGGVEEGSQEAKLAEAATKDREGKANKAREDIAKSLDILNKALDGRGYLLESGYTLADTHVWSLVGWLALMGTSLSSYANVNAWFEKVKSRPALAHS